MVQNTHWDTWSIKYTPSNTKIRPIGRRDKPSYHVTGYTSEAAAIADIDRFESFMQVKYQRSSSFEPILELPLVVIAPLATPLEARLVLASPAPEPVAFIVPKLAPG